MDFWPVFYKESLGSPWVISPQGEAVIIPEPQTPYVFLSRPLKDKSFQTMMEKMAVALKLESTQLTFLFSEEKPEELINPWNRSKKIMVFTDHAPLGLGIFFGSGKHQLMWTHSVERLHQQTELKKETWEHLKSFVSLK